MNNITFNSIQGVCLQMCPKSEILLREKENLLHILEMVSGTERERKPKADRAKMVKSFSRSAAGKEMLNPNNLRPPKIILKTVHYLLHDVISNSKVPWHVTYDFIMDRLRSVRQDMVIQNVSVKESICILQPIVRFYAYASYRLCDESIHNFDPHINQTHLQECLKRLLCLYDEWDNYVSKDEDANFVNQLERARPTFESLYLVLNLGNTSAICRTLSLSKEWRTNLIQFALELSLAYCKNNFVRVSRLIKGLPVLLLGVTVIHLPEIRRKALHIMSVAYNSKNLTFPLELLRHLLLYEDVETSKKDCLYYGLICKEKEVQFIKNNFDSSRNAVGPTHMRFVDEAFETVKLSDLMLNC